MSADNRNPARGDGPSTQRLLVAAGLVWLGADRVLVHRRAPDAAFGAGSLELPGGKVERGEHPAAALAREFLEEWGPGAQALTVGPVAEVLHHCYPPPGPEVVLLVYHVDGSALCPPQSARRVRDWGLQPEAGVTLHAFELPALPVSSFLPADRDWVGSVAAGRVHRPPAFTPKP